MTESNVATGAGARMRASWHKYWIDPGSLVKVEKSPPNYLKMRYLSAAFAPAPVQFVVVLRHPLATAQHGMGGWGKLHRPHFAEKFVCGHRHVQQWLAAMRIFREDLKTLMRNVTVVQFEPFMARYVPCITLTKRRRLPQSHPRLFGAQPWPAAKPKRSSASSGTFENTYAFGPWAQIQRVRKLACLVAAMTAALKTLAAPATHTHPHSHSRTRHRLA